MVYGEKYRCVKDAVGILGIHPRISCPASGPFGRLGSLVRYVLEFGNFPYMGTPA